MRIKKEDFLDDILYQNQMVYQIFPPLKDHISEPPGQVFTKCSLKVNYIGIKKAWLAKLLKKISDIW